MRRFESDYRINEGDDVLNRENAIHQDVDLRLDAIELLGQAFAEGNRGDIEALISAYRDTVAGLAKQVQDLLGEAQGGISADAIAETADRLFLTATRRALILSDLRGGVDASGDTMEKLLALIVGVVGGAPAGRQNLKAINDAVVSNTAALNAILTGADPLIDTFAEIAAKFTSQGSSLTEVMAAIGNRLRLDAPAAYSDTLRGQGRANLIGAPATISTNGTFIASDVGRRAQFTGAGGITRTLPAISSLPTALWATDVLTNNSTGVVTIAAAGTDAFEGAAGGSVVLFPKQRACVYLDTDGWHVGWVDRSPVLSVLEVKSSTPVASVDIALPDGYGSFDLLTTEFSPVANGAVSSLRVSYDAGASIKTDAQYWWVFSQAGNPSGYSQSGTTGAGQGYLMVSGIRLEQLGFSQALVKSIIHPGGGKAGAANRYFTALSHSVYVNTTPAFIAEQTYTGYYGAEGQRANLIRLYFNSGNINSGRFVLRGNP